jgi:deoxyribodipyrimidine photo-lyase
MTAGDAGLPSSPDSEAVRSLSDAPGTVVWHRADLRIADNPAVAAAADESDRILPIFVFDPGFHDERGAACDARIEFLHDCLRDLDRRYRDVDGAGVTYAHGDPIEVLGRFVDAGWAVVASATATGRYGRRRDDRARERLGVRFVAGDGLVRDADRPREDWSDHVEAWFAADPFDWDPRSVAVERVETGIDPETVADAYGIEPTKTRVPPGGREAARGRLREFADRIADYPGSVSSPVDARDGTSGLSPYLRFGACRSERPTGTSTSARRTAAGSRCSSRGCSGTATTRRSCSTGPGGSTAPSIPSTRGSTATVTTPSWSRRGRRARRGSPWSTRACAACARRGG